MMVKKQPASGAKEKKGDIVVGDFIIQAKATGATSFRITAETMEKARKDAMSQGKRPLLAVRLADGRVYWVIENGLIDRVIENG